MNGNLQEGVFQDSEYNHNKNADIYLFGNILLQVSYWNELDRRKAPINLK